MTTTIVTKKEGMTRIHLADGRVRGVTVLSVKESKELRKKTEAKDGYYASVITSEGKEREVKGTDVSIKLEDIKPGQTVILRGIGKGKGFAGTIKRYSFARGPVSHGSHNIRKPGSIGGMYPQRVLKGQKMPGRLGGNTVTTQTVVEAVIPEESLILVRGAVPGSRKSIVVVESKE